MGSRLPRERRRTRATLFFFPADEGRGKNGECHRRGAEAQEADRGHHKVSVCGSASGGSLALFFQRWPCAALWAERGVGMCTCRANLSDSTCVLAERRRRAAPRSLSRGRKGRSPLARRKWRRQARRSTFPTRARPTRRSGTSRCAVSTAANCGCAGIAVHALIPQRTLWSRCSLCRALSGVLRSRVQIKKLELKRAKESAKMTHRERIDSFNHKLSQVSSPAPPLACS